MNNRQARYHNPDMEQPWVSYGDIGLLEAARRHATDLCRRTGIVSTVLDIEVRCMDTPEIAPAVFKVKVDLIAEVLDPRRDTDSKESA